MCRFKLDDILVDVMSTRGIGWAPANPWFKGGLEKSQKILVNGISINIMPLPYFIANKFAAFKNRGNNDPRTSKDFEDIVYVFENNSNWKEEVERADLEVRKYLIERLKNISQSRSLKEALLGHLDPFNQTDKFNQIMSSIKKLIP